MSQAIDILNQLESVFDDKQAKVLANVLLEREETSLKDLVTKEYLSGELNDIKSVYYKEMNELKDDLRKEMGNLKDDVNKRFDTMNERIVDLNKTIIRQTWWYLGGIAFLVSVLTLVLRIIK